MKRPMLPFAFVLAATLVTVAAGPAEQGAFASQGVSAKQARLARAAAEKREKEAALWVARTMAKMTPDEKIGQLIDHLVLIFQCGNVIDFGLKRHKQ